MESWSTSYAQEVKNYFVDNGELVTDVFMAIEALKFSDGIPDSGATQIVQGELLFEVGNHIVIYERIAAQRLIVVLIVKPK